MVPTVEVGWHVANKGGPEEYIAKNWERIVEPAIKMSELAASQ